MQRGIVRADLGSLAFQAINLFQFLLYCFEFQQFVGTPRPPVASAANV